MQGITPTFPVTAPPIALPPDLAVMESEPREETPSAISVGYPRLRTILRDRGLAFKPIFGQRDVAEILGKSDKTVRAWTRMGKIPCCYWPFGDPYFTPQNIEDFLSQCERRKAAK
jgi:hypothetical protein